MTLGFQQAGWECVLGNDIDKDACDTFSHNLNIPAIRGSVHDIDFHTPIDAIVAGFPCFTAGTMVMVKDLGNIPIENVEVGHEVMTHRLRWRKVKALMRKGDAPIRRIFAGDTLIETTDEHPFFVLNSGDFDIIDHTNAHWVEARHLDTENKLLRVSENRSKMEAIPLDWNVKSDRIDTVYNISVEEDESYLANNFVVHNCQSHSMSGKRLGLADPRGQVVFGVLRIAKEMRPQILAFENVKDLITSPDADGERGGALMFIVREMTALGYTVVYDVLDSNDHGIGQSRKRLFIIGSLGKKSWIKPRPDAEKRVVYDELFDLLDGYVDLPNHEIMNHKPETIEKLALLKPGESLNPNFKESWKRLALNEPSPTQKENHGALSVHPLEPRCITAREMARLQGFPDDFEFLGPKNSVLKQIGNAVPVPLARAVAKSILPLLNVEQLSNGGRNK